MGDLMVFLCWMIATYSHKREIESVDHNTCLHFRRCPDLQGFIKDTPYRMRRWRNGNPQNIFEVTPITRQTDFLQCFYLQRFNLLKIIFCKVLLALLTPDLKKSRTLKEATVPYTGRRPKQRGTRNAPSPWTRLGSGRRSESEGRRWTMRSTSC